MYIEKRPTCVTVIGWAWIVIGTFACIGCVIGLVLYTLMMAQSSHSETLPFFVWFFPAVVLAQGLFGTFGLISGLKFLRLQPRARAALEILTWLSLLYVVGFGIVWFISWITMNSDAVTGFAIAGAIMALLVLTVYCAPLLIMLKYLRSHKVRTAMTN